MKNLKPLLIFFLILLTAAAAVVYILPMLKKERGSHPDDSKGGTDRVLINYGAEIDSAAEIFQLPASYLKALCMLECSGKKVFPERFEPHVYRKLRQVKKGSLSHYEHVSASMLEDANDDALKNLASSWGPFQLMGYKCLLLGIKVRDIRGEDAVYHGVRWIDMTYGAALREKRYKDAFHIHNTGQPFPLNGRSKTHDPAYCSKGLQYMKVFR